MLLLFGRAYLTLRGELAEAELDDATALVTWCRAVKSDEELAFMRRAAAISEMVLDGAMERVEPGRPENEFVAEVQRDALRGVGDAWGDYAAIVPILPAGATPPRRIGPGTGAVRPRRGDLPRDRGLLPSLSRAALPHRLSGPATGGDAPTETALTEGPKAGLEAARAGNRAADVARALAAPLTRAGIARGARCGSPIGLSYPLDWGERTILFREEDDTVLEPGMILHFMPGLWMEA